MSFYKIVKSAQEGHLDDGPYYFSDRENIAKFLAAGDWIAQVTIPEDVEIVRHDDYMKADRIILSDVQPIQDWEAWSDPEFCAAAVKQNIAALKFIKVPSVLLEAVKENASALYLIEHQTDEICLAAVQENGMSLQFVKRQTDEICRAAVENTAYALKFVQNQTDEICQAAIKQNEYAAIQNMKQPTDQMILRYRDIVLHENICVNYGAFKPLPRPRDYYFLDGPGLKVDSGITTVGSAYTGPALNGRHRDEMTDEEYLKWHRYCLECDRVRSNVSVPQEQGVEAANDIQDTKDLFKILFFGFVGFVGTILAST